MPAWIPISRWGFDVCLLSRLRPVYARCHRRWVRAWPLRNQTAMAWDELGQRVANGVGPVWSGSGALAESRERMQEICKKMSRFIPNSTMIPNAFFDEVMCNLSEKALRAYLVITRKTTGWGKEFDSISIAQFQEFTGIKDERTIRAGLHELVEAKLIGFEQISGKPTRYHLIGNLTSPPTSDAPPTSHVPNPLHEMGGDPLHGMHPTITKKTTIQKQKAVAETVVSSSLSEKEEEIKAPRKPPPPYQDIIDLYHEMLKELPGVYKLNDQRKRHIKNLWADELADLGSWRSYFTHIRQSDFLMGRINGNRAPFVCTFDFIINPNNFLKIAEEKYHERKKVHRR